MTDAKKKDLQALYREIMSREERKNRVNVCRTFCEEVRRFVDNPNPTQQEKEDFYQKVVYKVENGVASAAPYQTTWKEECRLSSEELHNVFADMLTAAKGRREITSEDYENWKEKFFGSINAKGGINQPTIYNRVVAALFPKLVLCIPSDNKSNGFILLYRSIENLGGLEGKQRKKMSWFDMNREVEKALDEAFVDYPDGVDEFHKWAFAGEIWGREKKKKEDEKKKKSEKGKEQMIKDDVSLSGNEGLRPEEGKIKEILRANLNLVLTGAPGTGKTYMAKRVAKDLAKDEWEVDGSGKGEWKNGRIAFIQFHPGYDYSDFVIGMKPVLITETGEEVEKRDGKYFLVGTKTPVEKLGKAQVSFRWKDGIFKKFADKAKQAYEAASDKENAPKFVFLIDEINRADLSRVFGELFSLLEEEYRHPNANGTDIILPNGEPFVIPKNLYIIGTMNDIDRSVESMDFALRRRFAWYEVTADTSEGILDAVDENRIRKINETDSGLLKEAMEKLNAIIGGENFEVKDENGSKQNCKLRLGSEYQLGGAIFAKLEKYVKRDSTRSPLKAEPGAFDKLWNNHIKNILLEYLRGQSNRTEFVGGLEQVFYDAVKVIDKQGESGQTGDSATEDKNIATDSKLQS